MVIITAVMTWLPQIYHNLKHRSKFCFSLIYIFATNSLQILIQLYLYSDLSIFKEKSDSSTIYVITAILTFESGILVLQSMFEPRFILPQMQKLSHDYQKYYFWSYSCAEIEGYSEETICKFCTKKLIKEEKSTVKERINYLLKERKWELFFEGMVIGDGNDLPDMVKMGCGSFVHANCLKYQSVNR